ncbi:PIN domain-containing protein [Telmatobacter bradus]|uniref:PIN domain-containing protein n=1 Tax=Telmatobacter bradus TaxID=474953 RepID=UPI003B429B64
MIGIDTNVLIRYFVRDDPKQTHIATELIFSLSVDEPGWIAIPVLVETVWTLRRTYRLERAAIAAILEQMLASRELFVEQRELAQQALAVFRSTRADFADCLIAASARRAGCERLVTFDRVAARDAGMEFLCEAAPVATE